MAGYTLRLAQPQDADRLFVIHELAMRSLVEQVYGRWDDRVQRAMHSEWLRSSTVQVVENDDVIVGALHVRWEPDHAYLGRIELAPEHQGRGLGMRLISDLIDQATAQSLNEVRLEVWGVNPAVRL
jgi:ribosomal protein S18 acetylase RimI-like enzyme